MATKNMTNDQLIKSLMLIGENEGTGEITLTDLNSALVYSNAEAKRLAGGGPTSFKKLSR
jgi:hypothetical protein